VNRGQELVIGGYIPGPHGLDSIIVGYYKSVDLIFVVRCAMVLCRPRGASYLGKQSLESRRQIMRTLGPEPQASQLDNLNETTTARFP
jgi:hypothetical protein